MYTGRANESGYVVDLLESTRASERMRNGLTKREKQRRERDREGGEGEERRIETRLQSRLANVARRLGYSIKGQRVYFRRWYRIRTFL